MLAPYRDVLRLPGARGFVVSGLVARLPISMIGVGEVLLVQRTTGSYARAGAVVAATTLASAVVGPALGRQTDRRGQSIVLPWQLTTHVTGLLLLLWASTAGAPFTVLLVAALVAGLGYPAVGSLVRARWSALLREDPRLSTAFALEATLDEVVFVVGPVVVTLLCTQVDPRAGLLTAAAITALGGAWFLTQRDTEPAPSEARGRRPSLLRASGLLTLAVAAVVFAAGFASMEVVVVAFAGRHASQAAAGPMLALWSFGSLLAGFVTGSRSWTWTMRQRLANGSLILAAAGLPILAARSAPVLAGLLLLMGVAIAPTLVALMGVTEALADPEVMTEAFALVGTAIAAGIALGAFVGGRAIEAFGADHALIVPVSAFVLAAVVCQRARHGASQLLDRAEVVAG